MYSHSVWIIQCLALSRFSFVLDCVKSLNVEKFYKFHCGGLCFLDSAKSFPHSVFGLACKKCGIIFKLMLKKGYKHEHKLTPAHCAGFWIMACQCVWET